MRSSRNAGQTSAAPVMRAATGRPASISAVLALGLASCAPSDPDRPPELYRVTCVAVNGELLLEATAKGSVSMYSDGSTGFYDAHTGMRTQVQGQCVAVGIRNTPVTIRAPKP